MVVTRDLRAPNVPMKALFSRELIGRTWVASLSQVAVNITLYGMISWIPTFLVKQGMSVVSSLGYTTLMSFGGPVGALIGFLLADRLPRRASLMCASALVIVFGVLYPNMADQTALTLIGFLLTAALYYLVAVAFYSYGPELFPTALRLRGGGFANACGRFASILMPYVIVSLFNGFGMGGVVGIVVVVQALLLVSVALLPVDMRQSSLEKAEDETGAGMAFMAAGSRDILQPRQP